MNKYRAKVKIVSVAIPVEYLGPLELAAKAEARNVSSYIRFLVLSELKAQGRIKETA